MEKSNELKRSETWNSIYEIVKTLPRENVSGDAPDAPSVATSIEELFLKLLPIQNVSVCSNCKTSDMLTFDGTKCIRCGTTQK